MIDDELRMTNQKFFTRFNPQTQKKFKLFSGLLLSYFPYGFRFRQRRIRL
jgi:hypothetical protein